MPARLDNSFPIRIVNSISIAHNYTQPYRDTHLRQEKLYPSLPVFIIRSLSGSLGERIEIMDPRDSIFRTTTQYIYIYIYMCFFCSVLIARLENPFDDFTINFRGNFNSLIPPVGAANFNMGRPLHHLSDY